MKRRTSKRRYRHPLAIQSIKKGGEPLPLPSHSPSPSPSTFDETKSREATKLAIRIARQLIVAVEQMMVAVETVDQTMKETMRLLYNQAEEMEKIQLQQPRPQQPLPPPPP